jgi:hypothetical protein
LGGGLRKYGNGEREEERLPGT